MLCIEQSSSEPKASRQTGNKITKRCFWIGTPVLQVNSYHTPISKLEKTKRMHKCLYVVFQEQGDEFILEIMGKRHRRWKQTKENELVTSLIELLSHLCSTTIKSVAGSSQTEAEGILEQLVQQQEDVIDFDNKTPLVSNYFFKNRSFLSINCAFLKQKLKLSAFTSFCLCEVHLQIRPK